MLTMVTIHAFAMLSVIKILVLVTLLVTGMGAHATQHAMDRVVAKVMGRVFVMLLVIKSLHALVILLVT